MQTEVENDGEESIEDALRAAMAATEESSDEVTEEAPETTVSDRDEGGRFKSKKAVEPEVTAAAPEPATDEVLGGKWTPERAPSGWSPKVREHWSALPLEVRQEIIRREENSHVGVQKLQGEFAPLRELRQSMEPLFREMQQIGVNPTQHFDRVISTERVLRTADLPTKFETLMGIADDYGIPLREIINQSVGQEVLKSPVQSQIPQELRRELDEIRGWREQQELQTITGAVEQYGSGQEFFSDVRGLMADLIERGLANTLPEAYDKAVWMHPEVRDVMMERKVRGTVSSEVQARQAKAVGASVRPSGSIAVPLDDDEDDSVGAAVRRAYTSSVSNRL